MAFHIALNMAGAVSAGAYTAGVVDFLTEALDEWYAARDAQSALHGSDLQSWTIPAHEVRLDVMSGASAGGMCAAIAAVALQQEFAHVKKTAPDSAAAVNPLYQSWVRSIDILPLLAADDLPNKIGPVRSLLDSTPIEKIAAAALATPSGAMKKRAWLADPVDVILTLSNLRGIPYSVDEANGGSFEERIAYHADRIEFSFAAGLRNIDWVQLRNAAMATGAFPVMLASRVLERSRAEYENRLWTVGNEMPVNGECESEVKIQPAWDDATVPATFANVYADGGVTNNNPFECARAALAQAAGNGGENPRDAHNANAAVITVAPFPGEQPFDPSYDALKQSELGNVVKALLATLINQARFEGENLVLTKDPDVMSRYAVAPVDETAGAMPALLSASLGAFGGFIDQKFRDRDYQLGRRNCQQFLRKHLALPGDNVAIAAGVSKKPELQQAFDAEYSFVENGVRWYPVIPLMPSVRGEVTVPARDQFKTTPERLEQVADAAMNRLKAVLHAFANPQGHGHPVWSFLLSVIFDLGGASKIRGMILDALKSELGQAGQV
jgi:hypothetical protein